MKRRYRVCAVCGKRHSTTHNFLKILQWYGLKGDQAAASCIAKLPLITRSDGMPNKSATII